MKIFIYLVLTLNLLFAEDYNYLTKGYDINNQINIAESMYKGDSFVSKKDFATLRKEIKETNDLYKGPFDFILYFTSESVPVDTMLNVLHSLSILQDNNIYMYSKQYLIGFPDGLDIYLNKIQETTENKYKNIQTQEKVKRNFGLKVDPRFFEELNIKEAPAMAFATCPSIIPDVTKCKIKYLIRGDVSLYTFFDKISEIDPKYEILKKILIANKIVDKEGK